MPTAKTQKTRTQIRGVGWKKKSTISADKYEVVANAILVSLTPEPIKFAELVERVAQRLRDFEGSVSWYTITCARELEVRGQVTRHIKPVSYSRAVASKPTVGPKSKNTRNAA
jgi:hypothetical protein